MTRLGALTLAAEVCNWRRFASAHALMGFCGLVASEYSSGSSTHRGRLTKAGNADLPAPVPSWVWSGGGSGGGVGLVLRAPARRRGGIARRHHGLDPAVIARAWVAQQRLCGHFRRLAARKHTKSIVAAAIAWELAGFLWAEMTA